MNNESRLAGLKSTLSWVRVSSETKTPLLKTSDSNKIIPPPHKRYYNKQIIRINIQ